MERLAPEPSADPVSEHVYWKRPAPAGRPWVLTNMATSVDGATARHGVSGSIAGPGDRTVFAAIRQVPDAIVVGAATANAERYRVPRPNATGTPPRLVLVSGRLTVEPTLECLNDPGYRPIIATSERAAATAPDWVRDRSELWITGQTDVDPIGLLTRLHDEGHRLVLCEGGPTLLAHFAKARLIDEWYVTIGARTVGGEGHRLVHGPDEWDHPVTLRSLIRDGHDLFLNYLTDHGFDPS